MMLFILILVIYAVWNKYQTQLQQTVDTSLRQALHGLVTEQNYV